MAKTTADISINLVKKTIKLIDQKPKTADGLLIFFSVYLQHSFTHQALNGHSWNKQVIVSDLTEFQHTSAQTH